MFGKHELKRKIFGAKALKSNLRVSFVRMK